MNWSLIGALIVDVTHCIEAMLKNFSDPKSLSNKITAPAADYLFDVNEDCSKPTEKFSEHFHTVVTQGSFVCKRGRSDTQTAIAFLCTEVKEPNTNDQKKLIESLSHSKKTKDEKQTLKADETHMIRWCANAAFAVHENFKSHTGESMTMRTDAMSTTSTKQKLNVKSFTKAELVEADDVSFEVF